MADSSGRHRMYGHGNDQWLRSGAPYVVWLDAPGTGAERDGGRHPTSGRSGVVYPV
jgi:hypothetical protein